MVKIEDLKRINLLRDMPDNLLEIIAKEAQLSIFSTNREFYHIHDNIDTFYMLVMGQVALTVELAPGIDVIIDTVQSGASFGLSSLVTDTKASSTAVCQEPCEVITLYGKQMLDLFEENRELGYQMMLRMAKHYKKTMENRTQMIMKTLDRHPEFKGKTDDLEELTPIF